MLICGIIKPHALNRSAEIIQALRNASVVILDTRRFWYTREIVGILYDHMSKSARSDIARRLARREGLSLLLSVSSIEWFLELVGKESDPSACASGTIRARFGVHGTSMHVGSDEWHDNAFHRPIDAREAKRDLLLLFNLPTADS